MSGPSLPLPLEGRRVRIEAPGAGDDHAIVRLADDAVVGRAVMESTGGQLTIGELCIDPSERSYGCGSEAGWLLVNAAASAGYDMLRAWAAPDLGLSVYFWIRMGLRPLHGPGPDGGIWFERRLR